MANRGCGEFGFGDAKLICSETASVAFVVEREVGLVVGIPEGFDCKAVPA